MAGIEAAGVYVSAGENGCGVFYWSHNVKVSGQQGRLGRKSAALWIAAAVLWLPLGSAEWLNDLSCRQLSLWDG